MHHRARSVAGWSLSVLLVVSTLPLPSAAAPAPSALPPTLEAPAWAVGFSWTYNYDGPYTQSIGSGQYSYRASHMNDTYVSTVVGQVNSSAGPAWLIFNDHAGTMEGNVSMPIIGTVPATATFTSATYAAVRMSDYGIVNFTQDLSMTASVPVVGTVTGSAHNETHATPPFVQVVFGTPADGTLWRIQTNLTSNGSYQIGGGPPTATSGYLALDYNLSVGATESVTVPAGTFEAYNISGGGTADDGGGVYSFSQQFFWSPLVQNKVIDEGGYQLMAYDVNRPPRLSSPLPALNVTAGASAVLDLSEFVVDPDGDAFSYSCAPPSGLSCTVDPSGALNVSANPGLNASFNLTVEVDDGRPGGRAVFTVIVLVTGAGSTNQPPFLLSHGALQTGEDFPYRFSVADFFGDPEDDVAGSVYDVRPPTQVTHVSALAFTIVPPLDFFGNIMFDVTAFDGGGLSVTGSFTLEVVPINDGPVLVAVGPPTKYAHVGDNVTAAVIAQDADGDLLNYTWELDNDFLSSSPSVTFPAALAAPGTHVLRVTVSDPGGASASLQYSLAVFGGPTIVSTAPTSLSFVVGTGSTIDFEVTAEDPDTPSLDYEWDLDGVEITAAVGLNRTPVTFGSVGEFVLRARVADNVTADTVEWTVTVIDVPAGLISIESPFEGQLLRINNSGNISVRAAVDSNLSSVDLEWSVNGVAYSNANSFEYPVSSSGAYRIRLQASALYLDGAIYTAVDEVNVSVLIVVGPGPGTPGNNSPDNTTPPLVTSTGLDGLFWVLLILATVAGVAGYVWVRRSRKDGGQTP